MKELLKIRKFKGEEYKFYLVKMNLWTTGEEAYYISCETPENCLGYSDNIKLYNGCPIASHRNHPNWIMQKVGEVIEKLQDQLQDQYDFI